MPEDEKEDVYVDIGFRKNNAAQDYKLKTIYLKDLANRTIEEIREMLESEDEE